MVVDGFRSFHVLVTTENPLHFTHGMKTKGYDVIDVNYSTQKFILTPHKRG